MSSLLKQRLAALSAAEHLNSIVGIRRGLERETLRIKPDGRLADTAHQQALGSALTHPMITTDFSETLLEFITPVSTNIDTTLAQLSDVHTFTLKQLGQERLWPLSMPCYIGHEDEIQLAQYGSSNVGRMKTLYRQGLKRRYGSMMQAISGVHFNFSFPAGFWPHFATILGQTNAEQAFISEQYLALVRNYKRMAWLIVYLFGASPALCSSFIQGRNSKYPFEKLGKGTLYLPYATSLRMSDLGYTNSAQSRLKVTYNSLDEYIAGLHQAITLPSDEYAAIPCNAEQGYQQLNSNILQIENEFYSTIRPKRTTESGERPTCALAARGVEYIEVRALDVNPFSSVGVSAEQMRFLDVFLCYCLLQESPELSHEDQLVTEQNLKKVVTDGRRQNLELMQHGAPRLMLDWAEEIFADLSAVAAWLDQAHGGSCYQDTIKAFYLSLLDPANTYSGRLLKQLLAAQQDNGPFALAMAEQYRQQLLQRGYQYFDEQALIAMAVQSHQKQAEVEAADTLSFEAYLQDYFAPKPCSLQSSS